MPFYEYKCSRCDTHFDKMLPMSRYDEPQTCEKCGDVAKKQVIPVGVIFVGDDWASKNGRVARQMADKNARLNRVQDVRKREAPVASLVPNVGGEQTGTWSDAQKLAASKGADATSYADKVRKEQAVK